MLSIYVSKPILWGSTAVLAGGGAVTGIAVLASTQNSPISKELQRWGSAISSFFKASASSSDQSENHDWLSSFFTSSLPSAFVSIGQFIVKAAEFFKTSFTGTFKFFSNLGVTLNNFSEAKRQLEGLQHSLGGDSRDLKEFFEGIHNKIPALVSFFSDTKKSETFIKLFKQDQLEKTKKTLKILLGKDYDTKSLLTAEKGLAVTLINQFAANPEKVSKKLERLVELVDKAIKPETSSGSEQGQTGSTGKRPYELTKEKLRSFLQERVGKSQDGFELGLLLEIGASQQGVPLPSITSNVFSILGIIFGSNSSTQQSK